MSGLSEPTVARDTTICVFSAAKQRWPSRLIIEIVRYRIRLCEGIKVDVIEFEHVGGLPWP